MLTTKQIRAQVEALLDRAPEAEAFALNVSTQWTGPEEITIRERPFRVVASNSELALREALVKARSSGIPVVLLTGLSEGDLGEDFCARLARRRVNPLSSSEILRNLFQAKDVEPRLRNQLWLAEALVEARPPTGYPPVPSGRLDEETAVEAFFRQVMGFPVGRPDLTDTLEWSRREEVARRWQALTPEAATRFEEWLVRSAGSAASLVLASLQNPQPVSAVALGLAAGLVFQDGASQERVAARGRLEQFLGGRQPSAAEARLWEMAAARYLQRPLSADVIRMELEALDQLLRALRLEAEAIHSDHSPAGLEQRFRSFAAQLQTFVHQPSLPGLTSLDSGLAWLKKHHRLAESGERGVSAEMAVRLCRWLACSEAPGANDLPTLARRYQQDGAHVDWARHTLLHGDPLAELSRAYGELLQAALIRRESENRAFAQALAEATAQGVTGGLPGVEDVIPQWVAPLTRQRVRVLLLVIDGMSLAVLRELRRSVESLGFYALARAAGAAGAAEHLALAGLPTVTEWSRRLLIGGPEGAASSEGEKGIFQNHPALRGLTGPESPQLFLKGDLTQAGDVGLSSAVRHALDGTAPVLGVVVNAVDDHLLKGDQLHVPWSLERIPLLHQLLTAAGLAGRAVVLTSDHGHLLENDSRTEKHPGGDRYRHDNVPPGELELSVRGPRVAPFAKGSCIAPWSEQLIYTSKKNGYHGGLSPQEVLVPVMLLAQEHGVPEGWNLAATPDPAWWLESPTQIQPRPVGPPAPVLPPAVEGLPLFTATTPREPGAEWVEALVGTELFQRQHQLAGRVAPPVEVLKRALLALDERGGALLVAALAGRLGLPEFRLSGLLTGLRRVLNVEGYPVLTVDDASSTVRLNRELLSTQFDLPGR